MNIAREPAIVTVGMIRGGLRENIIPDEVEMRGTIRAFDEAMQDDIHERVTTLAQSVSAGSRAGCTVCINKQYPVTINDPALTEAMEKIELEGRALSRLGRHGGRPSMSRP